MRKPCKPKLRLVPSRMNKEYELVIITLSDNLEIPYDLAFWEFYEVDREWIDLKKKDDTAIHSYCIYQIISVKFERKTTVPVNGPDLKPVA